MRGLSSDMGWWGGYQIRKGVIADATVPSQITQTLAAGDRTKFTLNFWCKPALGVDGYVYGCDRLDNNDHGVYCLDGGGGQFYFRFFDRPNAEFILDIQAIAVQGIDGWYNLHAEFDSAQAEPADRAKLYVNGIVPALSSATIPDQYYQTMFADGLEQRWFGSAASQKYYSGSLCEAHYCDGIIVPVDAFFKDNAPVRYDGPHGPRGSFIEFLDAGDLGADTSGNSNDWTVTGCTQTGVTATSN